MAAPRLPRDRALQRYPGCLLHPPSRRCRRRHPQGRAARRRPPETLVGNRVRYPGERRRSAVQVPAQLAPVGHRRPSRHHGVRGTGAVARADRGRRRVVERLAISGLCVLGATCTPVVVPARRRRRDQPLRPRRPVVGAPGDRVHTSSPGRRNGWPGSVRSAAAQRGRPNRRVGSRHVRGPGRPHRPSPVPGYR